MCDWFAGLGRPVKRKPKMKVHYGGRQADYEYNARKKEREAEIDRILDKLRKSGYNSLTDDEKKSLFDASKKWVFGNIHLEVCWFWQTWLSG